MKTKTIRNYLFVLIPMLALAMISCKHDTKGTFTGSDKQPLNITIAQNDMIKFTKTTNSSRTIVADPFSAKTDLTFYLWGTAQSGQTLAPKNVTVTSEDGIVGKVILDIDCYNWSLTLAACASNDLPEETDPTPEQVLPKAVLIGYGNVDMMFTNSIKFTLTPKGLSKTGGAALTLKLEPGMVIPDGYTATAHIYDITTGRAITGSDSSDLAQTLAKADLEGDGASYTANGKQISPGTYSFQVEFTKAGENRKYVWNDTIIILPGKTVTETIVIPNLIGSKPVTPTDFEVTFNTYEAATDSEIELEESKYPGYYTAHFSWDGSAVKTEMNFAIEIAEVADDLAVTEAVNDKTKFEAIFGTAPEAAPDPAKANAKYSFNYLNDIRADRRFYRSGSLFANSEYVDVYLELGKRYVARLYSENNAGYSETAAYLTINPVESGAELNTINRYRVKYYTQGGTWNEGANHGDEPDGSDMDKIVYWSQSDQPYDVLNPVATTTTDGVGYGASGAPYLYQGPASWIYWITDLAAGTKYPDATGAVYAPEDYTDFKNLDLYASYSREGNIEVYNDKTYDILQAWVNAFGIEGTVSKTATNTVSKADDLSGAASTTVTVTIPSVTDPVGTWKYDKVSFKISYAGRTYFNQEQVGAARASANTFTIPLGNLPTGYVYNCLITARYQMTTVSYPFTIYLTD